MTYYKEENREKLFNKYLETHKHPLEGIEHNIDIEETIKRFGYSPLMLRANSEKLVVCYCEICGCERIKKFRFSTSQTKCLDCSNKINSNINLDRRAALAKEWHKNNPHPMLGRHHTEESKKLMSQNRTPLRGKDSPSYGKKGTHGKGMYYTRKDDTQVWMRSRWEYSTAKYFDENNILWEHEPKSFKIIYKYNGEVKEGTYCPDFFLPDTNEWWEIKGWWRDDAKAKYDAFIEQYPELEVKLMMEPQLKSLGIKTRWWGKQTI